MRFSLDSIFFGIAAEGIETASDAYIIYADSNRNQAELGAFKLPLNSTDGDILYKSDNEHISVDTSGRVISDGTITSANITMSCGNVNISRPVYVINSISGFSLSQSSVELYADKPESITLSVQSEPDDLPAEIIKWHSGDESIAYVDTGGRVIPNGVGTTSVYATTADGAKTAKCTVYVGLYDVSLKAVFITNAIDRLKPGASYKLSAYLYPDNVSNKTVSWKSSDSTVISVDPDGTIHAAELGHATITVEAANGKSDSFEIISDHDASDYKVISKSVYERLAEFNAVPQFVPYSYTLDDMCELQLAKKPVVFAQNRAADSAELKAALAPSTNASGAGKYQFIDLSQSNGTDAETLNRYLYGKGVLEGKGQQFIDAAKRYNLSELYLVTHAALESGSGFSRLAQGIDVNGTVVYNLFGIGAYDADAVGYGSQFAYRQGWTSVDAAIDGGARWISENYINNTGYHQNTLYKMRWNPDRPGEHQYATDIEWASAQARILKSMFDAFPDAELHYEIPLYRGESEFDLK